MPKQLQQPNLWCKQQQWKRKTKMTWPDGSKQPTECAVEKQTTKVNKTSTLSQISASQNDPIKLKISQSKVYLTK